MEAQKDQSLLWLDTNHLITEDNIILHPAKEDQVDGHIDHPKVGTQGVQVAKHTGRKPVTHTVLLKRVRDTMRIFITVRPLLRDCIGRRVYLQHAGLDPESQRNSVLDHDGQSRSEQYSPETSERQQHQPPVALLHRCLGLDGETPPVPSCTQKYNTI